MPVSQTDLPGAGIQTCSVAFLWLKYLTSCIYYGNKINNPY
jgi:hypothetical protein